MVVLTDSEVNLGVMILQMSRFASRIKEEIERDQKIKETLCMSEIEIKNHINKLKKEIFKDKIGTVGNIFLPCSF